MSDSITTSVEVAVAPIVAFDVFTRDIDAWYRIDVDALPDITRTGAIRFEPCVGGRLLDVHDLATGAGRELGRITAWEPGHRLVFTDNEGTEVAVDFEPCRAGTRVTLTHSGVDRLAPARTARLRRSGWAALAPLYRDYVAPNARPVAIAVVFQALLVVAIVGALGVSVMLTDGLADWAAMSLMAVILLGAGFAVVGTQDRLVRRWLPSEWLYRRVWIRLFALLCLGLLAKNLYGVVVYGDDLSGLALPVVLLLVCWSFEQQGPARGRSLRRVASAGKVFAGDWTAARATMFIVIVAALAGLLGALRSIDVPAEAISAVLLVTMGAGSLYEGVARRRERRTCGFDPNLYLAVARPVGEDDQPPQLLVHRNTTKPEHSGWYAYAAEQQEKTDDLVVWSMRDLVNHAPQTADVLREGDGTWKWDQAQRTYRRIEHLGGDPRPA